MQFKRLLTFAAAIRLATASLASITVDGNAFFVGGDTSNRFYIRGVDYQPGGSSKLADPLADPDSCKRDIAEFKDLGINTIRVYSVDNTADHDDCMKQLDDAGIYVLLDVNIPNASIARDDGNCSYNSMYLEQVFATVKLMSQYNNTLGFFAGNEVINDDQSTSAATYVKAVVRDIKTFMKNNKLRMVPTGYSAADVEENRLETAQFFNCGDDEMARSDMFGFNDYSWCGSSSFSLSGYDQKVKEYSNYSIPLFLSEFGCNKVTPRPFGEVASIYSTKMSSVFSGGLVYEYSQESSNYGLVQISSDNKTVETLTDFDNLKKAYANAVNPTGDGGYQTNLPPSECPAISSNWNATSTLPDTPAGARKFLRGDAEPSGNGFKAVTQWACIAGDNNVDGTSSSSSAGSSASGSSSSSGSSSKSSSSSSSSSSASATHKASGAPVDFKFNWLNFVASIGVVAGCALL